MSDATRFGRVPLWLYESGVPLQAIATYGWLAGRYGHYDQVMPSYGTLAKELRVSRGSVIAYMKALVAVGALRLVGSGAADHTSNTYEIAFDRPFAGSPVSAGQNTDQSAALVSPLTRSGQNTDQAGQRAVHEEDVSKKTDRPPPPTPSEPAATSHPGPEGAAAGEGCADNTNPDADAVIGKLDLQREPGRSERTQLLAPITAALAAGWTVPDLVATLDRDWTGAKDRVRTAIARAKDLGPPRRTSPNSGARAPWCGRCVQSTRYLEHPETGLPLARCPDCHPGAAGEPRQPPAPRAHTPYANPADQSVYLGAIS